MNLALEVFQVREAKVPRYQVPANDVLSDDGLFLTSAPATPLLLTLAPGSVTWQTVAFADSYKIESLTSGTIYTVLATGLADNGLDEQTLTHAGITSPGFYRVIAHNSVGDSSPSAPMGLGMCFSLPPTGVNVTNITATGFRLNWGAAVAPTDVFSILVYRNPDFTNPVPATQGLTLPLTPTYYNVTGLDPLTTYYPVVFSGCPNWETTSIQVAPDPVTTLASP